jgi:large subunit ribosomal protein L4
MKQTVLNLDAQSAGEIDLKDEIFGLEPRADLIQRVIVWQLAKRRAGTHKTKTRGEINKTTRKMYKQKGTGRARHGAASATQFRGGAKPFGPKPRDHAIGLPKKVRQLGLKIALSSKLADGKLVVLDQASLEQPKTKQLAERVRDFGWSSVLLVDGPAFDHNLERAARNLVGVQLLPAIGANVYDILRRDVLILTKAAVQQLEERLA